MIENWSSNQKDDLNKMHRHIWGLDRSRGDGDLKRFVTRYSNFERTEERSNSRSTSRRGIRC